MSVYDLYFMFGKPGTYFLQHTNGIYSQNMPSLYHDWEKAYPIRRIKHLACDANDNIWMNWIVSGNGENRWGHSDLGKITSSLPEFLDDQDKVNCLMSFGTQTEQYVAINNKANRWQYRDVGDDLIDILKNDSRTIKYCSIGIDKAHFTLFANGEARWAIDTSYPDLCAIVTGLGCGDIVFAALNPYRKNEFFVALADGIVHIRASALAEKHILNILKEYPSLTVISSSLVKAGQSVTTKKPLFGSKSRAFTRMLAESVVGGVVTTAITAAFACTVM